MTYIHRREKINNIEPVVSGRLKGKINLSRIIV